MSKEDPRCRGLHLKGSMLWKENLWEKRHAKMPEFWCRVRNRHELEDLVKKVEALHTKLSWYSLRFNFFNLFEVLQRPKPQVLGLHSMVWHSEAAGRQWDRWRHLQRSGPEHISSAFGRRRTRCQGSNFGYLLWGHGDFLAKFAPTFWRWTRHQQHQDHKNPCKDWWFSTDFSCFGVVFIHMFMFMLSIWEQHLEDYEWNLQSPHWRQTAYTIHWCFSCIFEK